jgi:hypothetical protein
MDTREKQSKERQRSIYLNLYEREKERMSAKNREIVEIAASRRYLVLPKSKIAAQTVKPVYIHYCYAHGYPELIIGPAYNKHNVHIELYLDPLYMDYRLNLKDETFCLMMLLCHEWSTSNGHIHFKVVSNDNAEEVARQLLAFCERSAAKYL